MVPRTATGRYSTTPILALAVVGILGLGVSGPMLGSYSTGQSSPLPLDIKTPPVNTVVADIPIWGGASGGSVLDAASGAIYQPSNYTNVTVIDGATDSVEQSILLGIFSSPETPTYVGGSVNQIFVPQISSNSEAPDNVSVISGTTNDIVANLSTGPGSSPAGAAYDPVNGYLYVPDSGRANVTVLGAANDTVVTTIPVGTSPFTPAYDPADGDVYVPNLLAGTESIISTKTDTVVATISGLSLLPVFYGDEELSLDGPVYDPISQEVYQPDSGANNLTVLDGTTFVKNITVGSGPATPGIDPVNGNLYVPTEIDPYNAVTVVSAASNTVLSTIAVGNDPAPPTYDPANGEMYVPNMESASYTGSVSAINVSTESVVATIQVGENPLTPTFDPANDELFVPDYDGINVTVIYGGPSNSSGGSGGGGGNAGKAHFLGLPGDDGYLLLGGVAVVVVILASMLFLRFRPPEHPPGAPSTSASGPETPAPAPAVAPRTPPR
ncbi:MAG: YncE family protein [Thermoplasmata archaeon]